MKPSTPDPEIRRLIDAARDVWIRRLIDQSRANSLLFYRDLKVGTLDLGRQPGAVQRLLAGDALSADALLPPLPAEIEHDSVRRERSRAESRGQINHTLVSLQRKALGNLEEKGIETLFLALGMATWPATDGGRPYDAPVLLLPAQIQSRGRGGEDMRLVVNGEPKLNPVLLVTFPSARAHQALQHVLVPHDPSLGAQEESASREVDEVVRQVLEHAKLRPHESLGVIAMGIKHANRVQAALQVRS